MSLRIINNDLILLVLGYLNTDRETDQLVSFFTKTFAELKDYPRERMRHIQVPVPCFPPRLVPVCLLLQLPQGWLKSNAEVYTQESCCRRHKPNEC